MLFFYPYLIPLGIERLDMPLYKINVRLHFVDFYLRQGYNTLNKNFLFRPNFRFSADPTRAGRTQCDTTCH